ncbi:SGNH/GDSL hydrolase family protein [Nocardioides sp. ChNu-153]|uniref:SGNH/GDSL hydrolase family protein n=1 Tax=unclassified Nocardioides TaxID=2615069 RepID=UPI002406B268|nr:MULTISPECIES: SGNH/GDSL hydrolase family protein [unclassified Nocardioides]MDF9716196.1 SGNH/GDSL hydrolase family protein [Nocardioides sp. ChNu-99]MDN7121586.1 SGNH/GDSL hydrolase family protein [Nocardioides sp. ChNu-153]
MATPPVRTPARRRTRGWVALPAVLAAGLALAGPAAPALADPVSGSTSVGPAAGGSYVALGDSYSSGTGTREYLADGTQCLRSVHAFPSLLASAGGWDLDFRACSGAVVADVRANQLTALSAATDLVTLSVGGNDAGFTDVITECAQPGWMSDCDGAIDGAQAFIGATLPARLSGLYADVRAAAPNADVVVAGYPRLFQGEDCDVLTFISPAEMTRLNATADQLDARTAAAARAAGFRFVDPTAAFTGHAVCDEPAWLNGLSNPVVESYHPNTLGHAQGYVPLVSSAATGSALAVTPAVVADAEAHAGTYVAQQAPYAAYDRTIAPRVVETAPLHAAQRAIADGTADPAQE